MSIHYTLRLQFKPDLDSNLVERELLELVRTAHVDEVMLMIYLNELNDGHETLDEVREWLDVVRPWKKALEREGVAVSLNPGHTIMQCDRGRRLKPGQNWQTLTDRKGRSASAISCPLDPTWRAYFREVLALYAAEGYRVIWIEDDIRLFHHPPLEWGGCFCPLHVAEFNRCAGTSASREELVQRVLQPGTPHPWRKAWFDMLDETQTAMVDEWRQIVESGGARLGLMSSGLEMHAMEGRHWPRWWKALAGDGDPVHRPHFVGYNDTLSPGLPRAIAMMDMNRMVEPPGTEIGPEIENSPHGWAKSYRQTAAAMVVACVFGADCLNISLYNYVGNLPSDDPTRMPFLADWKPALDWLGDLFPPSLRSQGVGCPWTEEMSYHQRTSTATDWMELHCPASGWAIWLGGFGHAFQMRSSETVNALAGGLAWAYSDDEIHWMLKRGLLLDGPAAAILVDRGFGEWLGLVDTRFVTQQEVVYVVEEMTDPQFALRVGAQVSVNARPYSHRLMQGQLLPGARAISVLKDPKQRSVGHGVIIYDNALGGRVAIGPWDANESPDGYNAQRNVQRAAQVDRILHYLSAGRSMGSASGAPYLISQFLTDARCWRGVIWNASPDAVETFRVRLPAGMQGVAEAVQLDARGRRVAAQWQAGELHLAQPLHQWECVVLRDSG